MTAPNRLVEWLPDSLANARPSAPGQGVYLFRASDTGALSLWDGAAWRSFGGGGGGLTEEQVLALLADALALIASMFASSLAPGAGLPAGLSPALITGTGAADSRSVSMPSALTLANGVKYLVEGRISARKADGTLLLSRKVEGTEFVRSAGAWALVTPGDVRLLGNAHADLATVFADDDARPTLGFNGSLLTIDWTALLGAEFVLEADLLIASKGTSTV
jgi:hypothetical protein